jgi:hypothetical protein
MKKLRFFTNKWLDKRMAEVFLDENGGGIDFGKNIVKLHPALGSARENHDSRKVVIREYFDEYYASHKKDVLKDVANVEKGWRRVEENYSKITENIFGGYNFPPGMYIAYASIINCNPRFLDSKTFQFFYKKGVGDAINTIAHELLHFIFFDFVEKEMKNHINKLSSESLWDISEIFNVIVLRSPIYREIVDRKYIVPYPNHRKYLKSFESAYMRSKNIKMFIKRGIDILSRQK